MRTVVEVIRYGNLALFVALGLACWVAWRREGSRAAAWSAATFGLLGATVTLLTFLPDSADGALWHWLTKLGIAGLVVFPYFLYRFVAAFDPPGRGLERFAFVVTAGLVVWTFALPRFPEEGEPRSTGFTVYVVAFLTHWSLFSVVVAYRMWRAGRDQPGVAKRRVRLLAVGAIGITVALIISGAGVESVGPRLLINLLVFASAVLFFLGVAPPPFLRAAWRRPEQERLREAVTRLLKATTTHEIADDLLPHVAGLVGAPAAALVDAGGNMTAGFGAAGDPKQAALRLELPAGELVVWTSPVTPFFGQEEIDLLRSLAVLLALGLERTATQEREREALERLREVNELKDTFLSAVSHELRTPLTAILGFAMTLEQRGEQLGPERSRELLHQLVVGARRLETLLSDLLDLDRLTRGIVEPRLERTDVGALVIRVVEELALGNAAPRVSVESVTAEIDVAKVERIVENLIYNAYKHTPPDSQVSVSVTAADGGVLIAVDDDGAGVPPELRERIFEPFQRGRPGASHASGTGIGLSLVARFAALHGGRAWIEDRDGGGSSFRVLLPFGRPPTGDPRAGNVASAAGEHPVNV